MADDLTSNPWVCVSAGAKTTSFVFVDRIAWKNATAAGHTVKVTDTAGKTIFEHFAPGSIANMSEPIGRACVGLTVSQIDSGKLYITFR